MMMGGGMMAAMGLWAILLVATVLAILAAAVLGSIWLVRRLAGVDAGPTR